VNRFRTRSSRPASRGRALTRRLVPAAIAALMISSLATATAATAAPCPLTPASGLLQNTGSPHGGIHPLPGGCLSLNHPFTTAGQVSGTVQPAR